MTSTPATSSTPAPATDSSKKHWLDPLTADELRALYQRMAPAGARLREELSCAPFWADGQTHARNKALASGQNPDLTEAKYWMGLAGNEVNAHRPETASSNAVAAHWLELLNSEIDSPATTASNASSIVVAGDPLK